MNSLIQCKTTILSLLIASVFACLGLLPKAQAVVPAPDSDPFSDIEFGKNRLAWQGKSLSANLTQPGPAEILWIVQCCSLNRLTDLDPRSHGLDS